MSISIAKGMWQSRIQQLMAVRPELTESDELLAEGLMCPACKNLSVSAIRSWDAEIDEFGRPFAVSVEAGVVCKVCGLRLDEEDVEIFIEDWNTFQGSKQDEEKKKWTEAFSTHFSPPPIGSEDLYLLSEL